MRHGSVFTGIGGFDLAAEWMGWENVFNCEINAKSREKLKYYWPNAISYEDIKKTDFTIWRGKLDLITGGDPCQPSSIAGLGKGTKDDRYLWPEMFRAATESQCPWIVNENVIGTVSNGILDIKINDLENSGYSWQAFNIPAEAVGALHQRERIWLIGYNPNFNRNNKISGEVQTSKTEERSLATKQHQIYKFREPVNLWSFDTNSNAPRWQEHNDDAEYGTLPNNDWESSYFGFGPNPHGNITRYSIESGIMGVLNGLPEGMDYTERNQRIKELGNSIVPQVALQIFKAISQYELNQ